MVQIKKKSRDDQDQEFYSYLLTVPTLLIKTQVGSNGFGSQPCILANDNPISNEAPNKNWKTELHN